MDEYTILNTMLKCLCGMLMIMAIAFAVQIVFGVMPYMFKLIENG